ncbi:histidine phosphatase family protein [Microbacterium sp. 179-B 1A2 NHS]|uniref:SixA phosphatase family protein n=1 Tax=Microbacterium sp. 179-B 1A2 NHS TaxID=3142383 RepID=UPI00399F5F93
MITLAIARHAKSEAPRAGLDDHDRPLTERGRRDAAAMAARLADRGFRPARVVSSTALRARTTAEHFAAALDTPLELDGDLYGAPATRLLAAAAASGLRAVLVVAHDPGMTVLADRLSGGGIGHMPTCAVATFVWDTDDWDVGTAIDPVDWAVETPGDLS